MPARDSASNEPERLQRLEEHAGFTEHTLDQLTVEILELNKRLAALAKRLDAFEGRLTEIQLTGPAGPPVEKPPHSAGPG